MGEGGGGGYAIFAFHIQEFSKNKSVKNTWKMPTLMSPHILNFPSFWFLDDKSRIPE